MFSKNNSTMEPPTCSCSTMHYTRKFQRSDPNICSRTTPQHLNITLLNSFNQKCIMYKKKIKKGSNILNCISRYLAAYIKLDPRTRGIATSVPGTLSSVC